MKKFASLLLTVVLLATMLTVFAVPASASEEQITPGNGGELKLNTYRDYGYVFSSGEFTLKKFVFGVGSRTLGCYVTIPEDTKVTVTSQFTNHETVHVYGTLILNSMPQKIGTIIVHCPAKVIFNGGTNDTGTVTYTGHTYENGICTACGFLECTETGVHNYQNGICTLCNLCECEVTGEHTYEKGICTLCGAVECLSTGEHTYIKGFCAYCGLPCTHNMVNGICTVCGIRDCKITGKHIYYTGDLIPNYKRNKCTICGTICDHIGKNLVCAECHVAEFDSKGNPITGSTLSEGNIWIVIAIAALVIGLGGGFFIGTKKKKKPALAGTENTDEE